MKQAIVKRLRTGKIKNVVEFGTPPTSSPYIVVKFERVPGGRNVRVIVHYEQGYGKDLERYIFKDLSLLLRNWKGMDSCGNTFKVKETDEYTDVVVTNDDTTISMERVFYVPLRLH
jgi:hypothetical protein